MRGRPAVSTKPGARLQALILAGGEGTRLRPLTTTIPKPVLPLANRPFISYMLDWLAAHGFREVVMSCGFLADGVRAVLGDGAGHGLKIRYVEEPEPLGTAGAVKFAEDLLEERFAVLNGDILTDFDLSALHALHGRRGARATIALIEVEDPSAYGLVLRDSEDRVTEFLEKPEAPLPDVPSLINAGAYVLEHEVLASVPEGRPVSFEREVFPALVGDGLFGCAVSGYWIDIGTPERYLQSTRDILEGTIKTAGGAIPSTRPSIGEDSTLASDVELRQPVLVGVECEIGEKAEVGPVAVLGDRCLIGPRSRLENAVLLEGASVGGDAVVRDSIVGSGAQVGAGSSVEGGTIVGAGARVEDGAAVSGGRVEPPESELARQG
jgi:mannose-1-phosphate guanylyltransferase